MSMLSINLKIVKGILVPEKICVIGEGSWGSAIAILLAENGHEINLWCHNPENAHSINYSHVNEEYLPKIELDAKIKGVIDFNQAFDGVKLIFEAIPVKFLRKILQNAKSHFSKDQTWVILSKGLEQETFLLPSQIVDDVFFMNVKKAAILGPSFAHDLILKKFTGVDISSTNDQIAKDLIKILENNYFKLRFCGDMIGMQLCAALKNVITLAIGIAQGSGFSDNTKAYIFTKGIEQISFLIKELGGSIETVSRLCGIGDLVLSAFGKFSKNLQLGVEIGQGKKIKDILNSTNSIPEGINTIQSVQQLIAKNKLKLSFFEGIYEIIFKGKDFNKVLSTL